MDNNKINKMINDDHELESIMAQAMHTVGKEHDDRLIAQMASLDEDEMLRQLAKSKIVISRPSLFRRAVSSASFRAAAACIVCALIIWSVSNLHISQAPVKKSSGYASMFQQYYTEYHAQPFDAQGDQLNIHNQKSTARLIQDASQLLSQHSRKSTLRAIEILEWLLDNQWRKTALDPEIHWYLGLAYLKDGLSDLAQAQFEIVKEAGKSHAVEAATLLADLEANQRYGAIGK